MFVVQVYIYYYHLLVVAPPSFVVMLFFYFILFYHYYTTNTIISHDEYLLGTTGLPIIGASRLLAIILMLIHLSSAV